MKFLFISKFAKSLIDFPIAQMTETTTPSAETTSNTDSGIIV